MARDNHQVSKDVDKLEKLLHEQRLQSMREVAEKLKDDSWKYLSLEKLLGL